MAGIITTQSVGSTKWVIANIIDSFMRWSVPVFVMISGSLLINPKAFKKSGEFFKKRFSRLLIPILVWPFLYIIWGYFVFSHSISVQDIINGYLLGAPGAGHLYFLFLIAGLYALTPLISMYANQVSRKDLTITAIAILAITTVGFSIQFVLPEYPQTLNLVTQGLPYVGYFMAGYLLKDIVIKRSYLAIIAFIASGIAIALVSYYITRRSGIAGMGLFFYEYPTIFVMIMSFAAFLIGKEIYRKYISKLPSHLLNTHLATIAGSTFGVYLIHVMVLEGLTKYTGSTTLVSIKQSFLLFILTTLISFGLSLLLMRIPYLKRLVQ
jgi:surface polysaccharide O-acyltransferase-like enzyme